MVSRPPLGDAWLAFSVRCALGCCLLLSQPPAGRRRRLVLPRVCPGPPGRITFLHFFVWLMVLIYLVAGVLHKTRCARACVRRQLQALLLELVPARADCTQRARRRIC